MLIKPGGIACDRISPGAVVLVREDGSWEGAHPPSSERAVHAAIYAARPDVGAVVHAHPIHVGVLAVAREPLPPILDEVAAVLGGEVAVAPYRPSGKPALGAAAAAALGGRQAVILANHGAVTVGRDLEEAFRRLEVLERAAAVYVLARAASMRISRPE